MYILNQKLGGDILLGFGKSFMGNLVRVGFGRSNAHVTISTTRKKKNDSA